jgi:hypothetical protein
MDRTQAELPLPVQSTEPINQEIPAPAQVVAADFLGAQEDEIQADDGSALADLTGDNSPHDDACKPLPSYPLALH